MLLGWLYLFVHFEYYKLLLPKNDKTCKTSKKLEFISTDKEPRHDDNDKVDFNPKVSEEYQSFGFQESKQKFHCCYQDPNDPSHIGRPFPETIYTRKHYWVLIIKLNYGHYSAYCNFSIFSKFTIIRKKSFLT